MLKMAGEICAGIHIHPLHSLKYLTDVVAPAIAEGAGRVERDPDEVELLVPVLTIVGDSEEEKAASRAICRQQVAFYGSTPNYGIAVRPAWLRRHHPATERATEGRRHGWNG